MSYWKLTDDEIVEHYDAVASKISIPIMAYNNWRQSGVDMSPTFIKAITGNSKRYHDQRKYGGDIQRMHLRKELGEDVAFTMVPILWLWLHFLQALIFCELQPAPNLIPELNVELYNAIQNNDLKSAQQLFYQQLDLLKFIVAKGLPRAIKPDFIF